MVNTTHQHTKMSAMYQFIDDRYDQTTMKDIAETAIKAPSIYCT